MPEESWHYKRTCEHCGCIWAGLHCPHDGVQNRCPKCGKIPTVSSDECNCEFDWEDEEESPAFKLDNASADSPTG